jgi:hypothetical protein
MSARERVGRVVECTALEMRHTGNRIGGSNLFLSASSFSRRGDSRLDQRNSTGPK